MQLKLPNNCIVGIHYSGMHDSSVSIIDQNGNIIFAASLERYSRVKQDSRFPSKILDYIPVEKVDKYVFTNAKFLPKTIRFLNSKVHPLKLKSNRIDNRSHSEKWLKQIDYLLPKFTKKMFVNHHMAHASSSFYMSGFKKAICLVYDGGMYNEHYFGGVYYAEQGKELTEIDLFNVDKYANITFLYSVVTTILGFTPVKHEGKITGLAAIGKVNEKCKNILNEWLYDLNKISGLFIKWNNMYSLETSASLIVDFKIKKILEQKLADFNMQDIAATVQDIAK